MLLKFAQMAKEHSKCPSSRKDDDLGAIGCGQLVPAFDKVAFEGDVGLAYAVRWYADNAVAVVVVVVLVVALHLGRPRQ